MSGTAEFRFYEELNDFLPRERRKVRFVFEFSGSPQVKDVIESLGVPHTEIDLILVNGNSVTFSHRLRDRESVSVYPVFESLNISDVTRLRPKPLRNTRFILDVHLGKLTKYLRMLGFDTYFDNSLDDRTIAGLAKTHGRIILTRDIGLLKIKSVTHGYWIRSVDPMVQLEETLQRFDLYSDINPLSRCMLCNGSIESVEKEAVLDKLLPETKANFDEFFRCEECSNIYWKGSHYENMLELIERIKRD